MRIWRDVPPRHALGENMGATGYIDKRLRRTNERVIYRAHLSWIPVFTGAIPLLAVTSLMAGAALGISKSMPICLIVFGIGLVITLLTRVPKIIRNVGTDIVVTDRRLHTKRGLINIENDRETPLTNIDDTIADPGPIGRLLGYGNVFIHTFGGGQGAGDEFDFPNVSDPFEFVAVINETRDNIASGGSSPYGNYPRDRGRDSYDRDDYGRGRDYDGRGRRGDRDSYGGRGGRDRYDDRDGRDSYSRHDDRDSYRRQDRRDAYGGRDRRDSRDGRR